MPKWLEGVRSVERRCAELAGRTDAQAISNCYCAPSTILQIIGTSVRPDRCSYRRAM